MGRINQQRRGALRIVEGVELRHPVIDAERGHFAGAGDKLAHAGGEFLRRKALKTHRTAGRFCQIGRNLIAHQRLWPANRNVHPVSRIGLQRAPHRLRHILQTHPVDFEIRFGRIGKNPLTHNQRARPDAILVVHEHGGFDKDARNARLLQRAFDVAAAIMG